MLAKNSSSFRKNCNEEAWQIPHYSNDQGWHHQCFCPYAVCCPVLNMLEVWSLPIAIVLTVMKFEGDFVMPALLDRQLLISPWKSVPKDNNNEKVSPSPGPFLPLVMWPLLSPWCSTEACAMLSERVRYWIMKQCKPFLYISAKVLLKYHKMN